MTDRPTRRDLMRPVQLLAIAFACALFAGIVTLVSGGVFQTGVGVRALPLAGIVAGITFIGVLLGLSLLLLAIDPQEVGKTIDRPVLYDPEDDAPDPDPATDGTDAEERGPRSDPA